MAASFWDRLAEHDPLDSRIAASLIGELVASGNVVSALRRARGYEGLVRRELGIEPDGSVKGLVSRLLSQAAL